MLGRKNVTLSCVLTRHINNKTSAFDKILEGGGGVPMSYDMLLDVEFHFVFDCYRRHVPWYFYIAHLRLYGREYFDGSLIIKVNPHWSVISQNN